MALPLRPPPGRATCRPVDALPTAARSRAAMYKAAHAARPHPVPTPQGVAMASSTITLTAADGFQFPAYVSEPAAKPRGAIVVLPEIFGVNSHIRGVADRFAAAGYLAISPSTFERAERGVETGYGPDDMKRGSALKEM